MVRTSPTAITPIKMGFPTDWRSFSFHTKASLTSLLLFPLFYSSTTSYTSVCLSMATRPERTATRVWLNHSPHISLCCNEQAAILTGLKCLPLACNKLSNRARPKQLTSVPQTIPTQNHSPRQASGAYCGERQWAPRGYIHTVMSWCLSTPVIDRHDAANGNTVSS